MTNKTLKEVYLEFKRLAKLKKKKMKEQGVTCICGKCSLPIYFTYDEIVEVFENAI